MPVNIEDTTLSDSVYTRTEGNTEYSWDAPTLVEYVKEKKYKVFKLPISGISLSKLMFSIPNMLKFADHVKRVQSTDLKYPIILDDLGTICDGWHRVIKALLEGREYIDAIRIKEMPEASGYRSLN